MPESITMNYMPEYAGNVPAPAIGESDHEPQDAHVFFTYVDELLRSDAMKDIDKAEQGKFIMDSFVGSLFRIGDIPTNNETVETPIGVLLKMRTIEGPDAIMKNAITRNCGLRDVVKLLASDTRTQALCVGVLGRVVCDFDSGAAKITLTTPVQVAAYIRSGATSTASTPTHGSDSDEDWVSVIETVATSGTWTDREYDEDFVRAAQHADQSGMDIALLRRSSDYIAETKLYTEYGMNA